MNPDAIVQDWGAAIAVICGFILTALTPFVVVYGYHHARSHGLAPSRRRAAAFILAIEGMGMSALIIGTAYLVVQIFQMPVPLLIPWLSLGPGILGVVCFLTWVDLLKQR